ncbi:hypothetical protein OUZ56_033562 [Daphnia magna]|uniref:Uncharacterized protein n=1 Tax=Daphnia magna TaxID=35525 RepID=A0ABR0BAU6_9CRUS|nr:hypothetical protein OUZ56_033562 [Daphnia magna]
MDWCLATFTLVLDMDCSVCVLPHVRKLEKTGDARHANFAVERQFSILTGLIFHYGIVSVANEGFG